MRTMNLHTILFLAFSSVLLSACSSPIVKDIRFDNVSFDPINRENHHTMAACLVRMARRRLAKVGLLEDLPPRDDGAELELYQLLSHEGNQAHSRYNSLIRELISFEHALDHRLNRSS